MSKELNNVQKDDFIIEILKRDLPQIYEMHQIYYQNEKKNPLKYNKENNYDVLYGIKRLEKIAEQFSIDLKSDYKLFKEEN